MAMLMDATSTHWFRLDRHDDDETSDSDPVDDATDEADAEEPSDDGGKDTEPKQKKSSDTPEYWKRRARENERRAKENAEKAKKFDELEAANKTEVERLADAKTAAEQRAQAALARAVTAEVKALASESFADPSDAAETLGRDVSKYLTDDGDIDTDAIGDALSDLLERKPHWKKPAAEPPKPKTPRPDPSQGSRGDDKPVDFRTADDETYRAKLSELGVRLR